MDGAFPTSHDRTVRHTDFSPPPPRTEAFELTFEQAFGRGTTFLDDSSFQYKAEVIKYFNQEANPPEGAAEFLNTLQAVLGATTQRESKSRRETEVDRVKQGVREKFIELYLVNQEELQRTSHAVHAMVSEPVPFRVEDFGSYVPFEPTSPSRLDPMVTEIEDYLAEEGSEVIEKYLAKRSPADPCNHPDEFYALYKAILQNCRKAPEPSLSMSTSMVPSAREILRSQFDRIYEDNRQGLGKCWSEDHGAKAREIEQLRSMSFVPSFSASPTSHYRTHHGLHGSETLSAAAVPMRDPMLQPPEEAFQELSSTYDGEFDFEGHGLSEISERIIAFYNAAPNVHPYHGTRGYSSGSSLSSPSCFPVGERDLADVIIMVLGTLKQPAQSLLAEETIDSVVRERFIAIFHYAAAMDEKSGGLKEVEITGINRLVAPSEQFREQPILMPASLRTYGPPLLGSEKGSGTPPGGGGGSSIVKVGLLLLALYLGYRLAKPAYQWIRGNQTTPVGE